MYRVFGKRYREVIRGWEVSVRSGGTNDRRLVELAFTASRILIVSAGLTGVAQPSTRSMRRFARPWW
jgi:hypothetical protein